MNIVTWFWTVLRGRFVGQDAFGNRYYEDRYLPRPGYRKKRLVVYKGMSEASKVPPEWHGWLHYVTDRVPEHRYDWQKPHSPNLTGTANAYFPPGHVLKEGREKATGDYEAWKPE